MLKKENAIFPNCTSIRLFAVIINRKKIKWLKNSCADRRSIKSISSDIAINDFSNCRRTKDKNKNK